MRNSAIIAAGAIIGAAVAITVVTIATDNELRARLAKTVDDTKEDIGQVARLAKKRSEESARKAQEASRKNAAWVQEQWDKVRSVEAPF